MIRALAAVTLLACTAVPAQAQHWSRSWAAAPQTAPANQPVPDLKDATVRQVVLLSNGGNRIRVRLSNEMTDAPVNIGKVTVALADADGRTVPGTTREVRFDGEGSVTIPANAPMVSEPIAMPVKPQTKLAISIHYPDGSPPPTMHLMSAATAWIAPGDQTGATTLANANTFMRRIAISGVDVETARPARTIVPYGDSITDGTASTRDANMRWPDILAKRLTAAGMKDVAVANLAISGNRVLTNGNGLNALARFDRDVLSVPGVRYVVVLEGVNDFGAAWRDKAAVKPTADDIIDGYRQMIIRAHDRGVKMIFATIAPYKGAGYWSEYGEAVRGEINTWIRTNREAAGFIDFDKATRDSADPLRLIKTYDSGDALHPSDAGYKAMGESIDLKLFR